MGVDKGEAAARPLGGFVFERGLFIGLDELGGGQIEA
jgi:hypothetical protein